MPIDKWVVILARRKERKSASGNSWRAFRGDLQPRHPTERSEMRKGFALLTAIVAALAQGDLEAADATAELPPYTPAYEPRSVDERGVWMEADERERMLRDSPLRIRDENLERYIREVLCREVGADRCTNVRVYVIEIPAFNA